MQRGNIWKYQLQDWAQASSDFVKATTLDKENGKAWKELCLMYFQTQLYKESESSCLKAFTIDSSCKKCSDYYTMSLKKNKPK